MNTSRLCIFFFSSRRRHTRCSRDWSSDVCSSDLEGSYDAIAERLFNELPHQRFLLEYDSPRAGSFAPLRFVPRDKIVVLGLVSTKVARLEPVEELKRRIDEAARFVPLANLALSPQCGFGSDVVGNLVSEDDQKRKLERMVETARQVWR